MTKVLHIARYPFTTGAVVLAAATLVGLLPYGGTLAAIVAGAFAIPIVRASGRSEPPADAMPRLLSPTPGLVQELGAGAALHFVYFAPFLSLMAMVFLAEDVPAFEWLLPFTALPLFLQLFFLVAWPAAAALLAIEGTPFPAFSRARVMRTAEEMGGGYAIVVAMVVLGGIGVLILGAWLSDQGLIGEVLDSLLLAWFWIVCLHLVGRGLRKRKLFDPV